MKRGRRGERGRGGIPLSLPGQEVGADDPRLKSVVIEAGRRVCRYEPRWRELSDAMEARGKARSVIVGAIVKRWLRGLFHAMKELPMAA